MDIDKEVEKAWRSTWASILQRPDGSIDVDQLKKELYDYSCILHEVPRVYDHVTGGLLSKPNYEAGVVIAAHDDHVSELVRDAVKDETQDLQADADEMWMAIEMVAADDAFFTQYQGDEVDAAGKFVKTGKHDGSKPKLCLLMNDVWSWASADGETIEWADVPAIHALWKEQGSDGLLVWACKKRNMRPQKPLFDKLKPEVQAQVKDLPRAGDVTVPVGDGSKVVVFDDGWGGSDLK